MSPEDFEVQRKRTVCRLPKIETSNSGISHGHALELDSSYKRDFPAKYLPPPQPQSAGATFQRKHNPHPQHVYHIRRLQKKPICHVRTLFQNQGMENKETEPYTLTSMKQDFPPRQLSPNRHTRFGCNKNKHYIAEGIVPANAESSKAERIFKERMLPACSRTTVMTTHTPYLPNRKRLTPPSLSEGWDMTEPFSILVEDNVGHSLGLRKPMRKRRIPGSRDTTLQVGAFNENTGGLTEDKTRSITGRKLAHYPLHFYEYYDRAWTAEKKPKWVEPF